MLDLHSSSHLMQKSSIRIFVLADRPYLSYHWQGREQRNRRHRMLRESPRWIRKHEVVVRAFIDPSSYYYIHH